MKAIDINKLKEEANRCFLCKVPKCKKYCPIDTQIPAVIQLFKENKIDEAGEILFNNNPLSAICGVVCPQKCIDISSKPVVILQDHCLHCGKCQEVCPKQVISRY